MLRLSAILWFCLACWSTSALGLTLTPPERDWLAKHPELRLGVDATWPPFEFRDEKGRYQGLTADYMTLIEKRLGIRIKPIEPASWSETLTMAKRGQLNLLPGIMATPERESYLSFTHPYLDFPIIILARRDGPQPKDLSQLYGLNVGVVKDYAPHELLKANHPDLHLEPLASTSAALQALATGEIDAMVGDLASSTWSLRQAKLEGLLISGETPYRYQLAMAAPKDQQILIGILNKLLSELTPQEIQALQQPWVSSDLQYTTIWRDLLLYGLPALLLIAAILAGALHVNRTLRREISRRKAVEKNLRNSEKHYRGLVESLNAVAWQMDPLTERFSYVSPQAEDIFGYPLASWLEPGFWQRIHDQRSESQSLSSTPLGTERTILHQLNTADGNTLWVRSITTLIEREGKAELRGLLLDMSATKQAEQALRVSEQKFASVFNNSPDMMVIARRATGQIITVNHAFEQQLGISVTEALGKTGSELGLWGAQVVIPELLDRLQREPLKNREVPMCRRNGEPFTSLLSAQPIQFGNIDAMVLVGRDISELKNAQRQLQASEEKFAKAFHATPDGMLLTRIRDGKILETNKGFSKITGYSQTETQGRSTHSLQLWANTTDREWLTQQVRARGSVNSFTAPIRNRDGSLHICEISAQQIEISGEQCMISISRDITESSQLQEKLRQAATVFESTAEAVMITDLEQRITAINRAFTQITGFSEEEALGQTPRLLSSGQHDRTFFATIWHQLAREGHWQGEIINQRKSGEHFPCRLTISAVRNPEQQVTHFVGVFADIALTAHS